MWCLTLWCYDVFVWYLRVCRFRMHPVCSTLMKWFFRMVNDVDGALNCNFILLNIVNILNCHYGSLNSYFRQELGKWLLSITMKSITKMLRICYIFNFLEIEEHVWMRIEANTIIETKFCVFLNNSNRYFLKVLCDYDFYIISQFFVILLSIGGSCSKGN